MAEPGMGFPACLSLGDLNCLHVLITHFDWYFDQKNGTTGALPHDGP